MVKCCVRVPCYRCYHTPTFKRLSNLPFAGFSSIVFLHLPLAGVVDQAMEGKQISGHLSCDNLLASYWFDFTLNPALLFYIRTQLQIDLEIGNLSLSFSLALNVKAWQGFKNTL